MGQREIILWFESALLDQSFLQLEVALFGVGGGGTVSDTLRRAHKSTARYKYFFVICTFVQRNNKWFVLRVIITTLQSGLSVPPTDVGHFFLVGLSPPIDVYVLEFLLHAFLFLQNIPHTVQDSLVVGVGKVKVSPWGYLNRKVRLIELPWELLAALCQRTLGVVNAFGTHDCVT